MSYLQSNPWQIPNKNEFGSDLVGGDAKPASYVAGSFFSPVSGLFAGCGSSSVSLSRSLRTTFPPVKSPKPCLEEKLANTRRMSADARMDTSHGFQMIIPTDKSDISVAWAIVVANQYLIKCGKPVIKKNSSVVTHFNVEDCKKCVGDFSSTYKVDLEYIHNCEESGSELERFSFIAKFLPLEDPQRVYVFETDVFRKETQMYFDVLPAVKGCLRFIKRRHPERFEGNTANSKLTDIVDNLIPECVYSSYNPDGVGVLVFKSCTVDGFEQNCNPEGLSLQEVLRVVKSMAKFHAASKSLLKIRSLELIYQMYPCLQREMLSNESLLPEVQAHLDTYSEFLQTVTSFPRGTAFPDLSHETCLEIREQFERLRGLELGQLLSGLCRRGLSQLTTIIHGELWEHNILISTDTDRVKIIDWKNAKVASATLDLAFFILSSTDHNLRAESLTHILKVYHETFTSLYSQLVSDDTQLSFRQLEADYFASLPYALLQCIVMFVLELQFVDAKLAEEQDEARREQLAERLQKYEYRALNLFRHIKLQDWERRTSVSVPTTGRLPLLRVSEADENSDLEFSD